MTAPQLHDDDPATLRDGPPVAAARLPARRELHAPAGMALLPRAA